MPERERAAEPDISEDALLGGQVRLLQPRHGHRAGTDAVLLAGLADVRPGDRVVDLGSASGAVGLMIAAREPGATITFVERDAALVGLARRNIALNALDARAVAVMADVFAVHLERAASGLASQAADLVVTNPPFFEDQHSRPSPDAGRRAAHAMAGGDLGGWLATAADLLRPGGRLVLIHRADRLDACLAALAPHFGAVRVTAVHARAETDAIRVLVTATKGARGPFSLAPPLVLHEADGRFTERAARMHAGLVVHPTA